MSNKHDKTLIAAAKTDPAAFESLYKKYADKIYNYFWYRVGHDAELAEDLTQETFTRAFKALPRYRHQGYSYHTYLRTIAHNILVSHYRSPDTASLNEVVKIPNEPIRDIEDKLDARLVWNAVRDNLSPAERDIILMRYRKNLPIKDIAKTVGKSENAVKLRLSRARRKLKKDIRLASLRGFQNVYRKDRPPRFL